ncbi:MAG: hypothetical protein WD989_00800 [Candidatus Paceibacterota bacterium]
MRLSQKWIVKLIALPESGMGYHIVDVHLKNGTVVYGLMVVNCEEIINLGNRSFSSFDIQDIKPH